MVVSTRTRDAQLPVPVIDPISLHAFSGPNKQEVDVYQVSLKGVLEGEPMKAGSVIYCLAGGCSQDVVLALYGYGFQLRPPGGAGGDASYPWTPFTVIDIFDDIDGGFRLNIFTSEREAAEGPTPTSGQMCHYFTALGADPTDSRAAWLEAIQAQLHAVTVSLFPPHSIRSAPVLTNTATLMRVMAGYLLCMSAEGILLVYAQLGACSDGKAPVELFTDEGCSHRVMTIPLVANSSVGTYNGVHCNIFELGIYRFCARTPAEREIWVRALGNTKVKLVFRAPDPSWEEIEVYRAAVQERVDEVQPEVNLSIDDNVSALLPARARPPVPAAPSGDVRYPEPMDDIFSSRTLAASARGPVGLWPAVAANAANAAGHASVTAQWEQAHAPWKWGGEQQQQQQARVGWPDGNGGLSTAGANAGAAPRVGAETAASASGAGGAGSSAVQQCEVACPAEEDALASPVMPPDSETLPTKPPASSEAPWALRQKAAAPPPAAMHFTITL
eukprot:NODE_4503_length_1883_cov_7.717540.p1 GENE.NODE_4503_length_1883_cov_7.717540~~NODE_4503_length_1883_cov_7.717540.p1  ORF type:complete len:565 (+),score=141.24 NODE_4503_length_1883_cov_7.717540:194-1696(+)